MTNAPASPNWCPAIRVINLEEGKPLVREALARLDRLRYAKGSRNTADIRLDMQRVMQADAAVFRTGDTLNDGKRKLAAVFDWR